MAYLGEAPPSPIWPEHEKFLNKKWSILNQKFKKNMRKGTAPCPDSPWWEGDTPFKPSMAPRTSRLRHLPSPPLHKILNTPLVSTDTSWRSCSCSYSGLCFWLVLRRQFLLDLRSLENTNKRFHIFSRSEPSVYRCDDQNCQKFCFVFC